MAAIIFVALGCSGGEKPSAPPTEAEAQTLVKATMSEFADAIDKGSFTAFRAAASKELQTQYTDDQLKTSFQGFVAQKEEVVPILREAAKKDVKFTAPPTVRDEKGFSVLNTTGTVAVESQSVNINHDYVYQDGKWKLLKVGVVVN